MPKKAVKRSRSKKTKAGSKSSKKAKSKSKKKSVKKVSGSKKAVSKPKEKAEVWIRQEVLGQAPEEHHFILKDGKRLKDIKELIDSLDEMHDDVFRHHVNEFKNDFSTWLTDIFDEKKLAEDIRNIDKQMDMQRKIIDHVMKKIKKLEKK